MDLIMCHGCLEECDHGEGEISDVGEFWCFDCLDPEATDPEEADHGVA